MSEWTPGDDTPGWVGQQSYTAPPQQPQQSQSGRTMQDIWKDANQYNNRSTGVPQFDRPPESVGSPLGVISYGSGAKGAEAARTSANAANSFMARSVNPNARSEDFGAALRGSMGANKPFWSALDPLLKTSANLKSGVMGGGDRQAQFFTKSLLSALLDTSQGQGMLSPYGRSAGEGFRRAVPLETMQKMQRSAAGARTTKQRLQMVQAILAPLTAAVGGWAAAPASAGGAGLGLAGSVGLGAGMGALSAAAPQAATGNWDPAGIGLGAAFGAAGPALGAQGAGMPSWATGALTGAARAGIDQARGGNGFDMGDIAMAGATGAMPSWAGAPANMAYNYGRGRRTNMAQAAPGMIQGIASSMAPRGGA